MSIPRFWRLNRSRYELAGYRCTHCGKQFLTPHLVCPQCHKEIERISQGVFPRLEAAKPCSTDRQHAMTVSVVIPAYNAATTIRSALSSLTAQDFEETYEIIVVDSSSDATPDIVRNEFAGVHLVHREQKTDPGTARNLGIARAQGEIIACIDADCIAPPDWLRRMVAAHRSGHEVVGGTIQNGNPDSLLSWAGYLGEFREWLTVERAHLVSHVPTCNISYDRSVFARFGGFPTEFYPQEDLLYHYRLSQHGMPIWFDPAICVQHMQRATWHSYQQHQERIGRITARVLKLTGGEGAFLARSRILCLLAAPILPWVKWLRTIGVFASQQPAVLRNHGLALAPLLLGLYCWAAGFVKGAWAPPLSVEPQDKL